METTETTVKKRRPGRVAGPVTEKYTILLPPELGDWGKRQPGGLSDLVRRLIQEAKDKQESIRGTDKSPENP
jgi:hypothetical protein